MFVRYDDVGRLTLKGLGVSVDVSLKQWRDYGIGIYVGGGVVVESTPKWNWGAQESTCQNVVGKKLPGTVGSRRWTKHGKLPWVDYAAVEKKESEAGIPVSGTQEKEDEDMPVYARLPDVPASYRPTIQKLMEKGALGGYRNPDPNSLEDNVLNLDDTYCRVMTTLDRLGKLD